MEKEMITAEIRNLPAKDKLVLMEEIWDSLRTDEIESPSWHDDVLGQRQRKIKRGEAKFISLDELRQGR
ncbi:MAG: addiction module protein [Bacteroidales bacterium]|nr:addiction module protein [Bacteroidales bacterium]